MRKSLYVASVGLLAAVSVWILPAQDTQAKANPNFTGGQPIRLEQAKSGIAYFRFPPGVRTKWHSHSGGQIILVEEGVARHQVKGGPVMELHAGETVYVGPNVVHWHGAAPDQGGVQFNISRGDSTWFEEVTDAEFTAKAKR